MAKNRGHKGRVGNSKYSAMLKEQQPLCKSQIYNELYDKLKREGRLQRFIATIQYCSSNGKTIDETIKFILNKFTGYINEKDLSIDCFADMVKNYADIAEAWGYGEDGDIITDILVKNKAIDIVKSTSEMSDIKMFNDIYGSSIVNRESNIENDDSKTIINFNLSK